MSADLSQTLLICGFGLVLGIRHSTDPDHLVALSTIVSRQRSIRQAAITGSLWGLGHTITIFVVGSLIILADIHIPIRLGLAMEFAVAVMLVLLGMLNMTGMSTRLRARFAMTEQQASHADTLGGAHTHVLGNHGRGWRSPHVRPLAIGLVHGLAGSAAVALLVLTTIHNPLWATGYLLVFGVGTVLGMVLMTSIIALPLKYGARRFANLNAHLAIVSGVVSFSFGLFLMYALGIHDGLFSSHPHWIPS